MPSYWVDQILMRLPTNDDAHYKEMGWLLDLLIEGLRTNAVRSLVILVPRSRRLMCVSVGHGVVQAMSYHRATTFSSRIILVAALLPGQASDTIVSVQLCWWQHYTDYTIQSTQLGAVSPSFRCYGWVSGRCSGALDTTLYSIM